MKMVREPMNCTLNAPGVAHNQIPRERSFLHCERQQGRRLQLSETPFVGIADEGKTFRPDDRRCRRRARDPEVHFFMRDQESFSRRGLVEP